MTRPDHPESSPSPRTTSPSNILPAQEIKKPLLESLSSRFDVVEKKIFVGGSTFKLLKVRDTNKLVDSIDPGIFSVDERLPYWADIWTSAIELARYCIEEADLNGKDVLELGCGLGLAGIAAAKRGANVIFSDYEDDALEFARCNAQTNLSAEIVNSSIRFINLDWRCIDESLPQPQKFDMILAADVVYERRNFFPLIDVLQRFLKPTGIAVFTEPARTIGEQFFKLLREAGFSLSVTPCKVELDGKTAAIRRAEIRPGKLR